MATDSAADRLLEIWASGEAHWVSYVAVDESGNAQHMDEVPEYAADKFKVHVFPVKPQCLKQHILTPRSWSETSQSTVAYEVITAELGQFLVGFAARLGLSASLNHFGEFQTEFVIGPSPSLSQPVRFHGTHFCALERVFQDGLRAVTCHRKGGERECFGDCVFTCADYHTARKWSQFVEVRQALGFQEATGWFINAVVVVAQPPLHHVGTVSFETLKPLQAMISLKMEHEIKEVGGWISPHYGRFVC